MGANSMMLRLAAPGSDGVCCGADGLFVGDTALLTRIEQPGGPRHWRPRPLAELDAELTRRYRAPVDMSAKLGGLNVVANALDAGEVGLAQVAALQLRLPTPPTGDIADDAVIDLVLGLRAGGLLAKSFDPAKHPHWPAGSPNSAGGQFEPVGAGEFSSGRAGTSARSGVP